MRLCRRFTPSPRNPSCWDVHDDFSRLARALGVDVTISPIASVGVLAHREHETGWQRALSVFLCTSSLTHAQLPLCSGPILSWWSTSSCARPTRSWTDALAVTLLVQHSSVAILH